jgi:hypothetical protein
MKNFLLMCLVFLFSHFSVQASYCLNNRTNPEAVLSCLKIDTLSQVFRMYNSLPATAPKIKPQFGSKAAQVEEIIAKIKQFFVDFTKSHAGENGYDYLLGVKSLVVPSVGSYKSKLDALIDSINVSYRYLYSYTLMRFKVGILEAFKDLQI